MRRYESLWVVNGDLPDEEVKSAIDKFSRDYLLPRWNPGGAG